MGIRKILLIGGGGHCYSVLDSLLQYEYYDEISIVDTAPNIGNKILGIEVIACDSDLPYLKNEGYTDAFITLGSIENPEVRSEIMAYILSLGFNVPNIVDRSSIIAKDCCLGRGIFIGKNSIINTGSIIGDGSIINTSGIIEHGCRVGMFSHISPSAVLCGNVEIGNYVHVGANATIIQGIHIGNNVIIGAGSVVLKDIQNNSKVVGNPGHIIGKRNK